MKLFKFLKRIFKKNQNSVNTENRSRKIDFLKRELNLINNSIRTSKYTLLNFIPVNLYIQFSNLVNVYFLIISIIQFIPGASPVGVGSTILPLSIFVLIAMAHEGYDDFRRHQMDHTENNRKVEVLKNEGLIEENQSIQMTERISEFEQKAWSELYVGDIVKIEENQWIPADLILLASSNQNSLCYVETAALDGETNLKRVQGLQPLQDLITDKGSFSDLRGYVQVEEPTEDMYKIEGNFHLGDSSQFPLNIGQVLLRGSILRNTHYVYGMILYSGEETKIRLNANRNIKPKIPFLTKSINRAVLTAFLLLLLLSIIATVLNVSWERNEGANAWYLNFTRATAGNITLTFLGFIVILNTIVPISLFVSLEFCKVVQAYFISQDKELYHDKTKTPAKFHTSVLNEDLGMVSYIFSDKTGTLTENSMHLRRVYCNNVSYNYDPDMSFSTNGVKLPCPTQEFEPINDISKVLNVSITPQFSLLAIDICHTVNPDSNNEKNEINYQATSPDELALVKGAKDLGLILKGRSSHQIFLECLGEDFEVDILDIIEFSSDRKRMSVICKLPDSENLMIICKGADSTVIPLLSKDNKSDTVEDLNKCIYGYSCQGLRTLVYGYKSIREETYRKWKKDYDSATNNLNTSRQKSIDQIVSELESDLKLLCAIALEDQLQDGVPDTIFKLQKAGIKIWVLTGDKRETAINIGRSCSLVLPDAPLIVLDIKEKELSQQIKGAIDNWKEGSCLVIDGGTFSHLEAREGEDLEQFLTLALKCTSVILCRSSPAQKATVVRMVRNKITKVVTLAIGDGGNDVSMIQEAHIGIGISGNEGLMAAKSSDYSIAQFRFLLPLLLIHGRWNYFRISRFILLTFYKCMTFYFAQYIYQPFTAYTGTSWYETWSFSLYNAVFTLLPVLVIGTLEQDYPRDYLLEHPEDYKSCGPAGIYFNIPLYLGTIIMSWIHSIMIVFPYFLMYYWVVPDYDLYPPSDVNVLNMGMSVYFTTVIVVSIVVAILSSYFCTLVHIGFVILSIAVYIIIEAIFSVVYPLDSVLPVRGSFYTIFSSASMWLPLILSVGFVIAWKCIQRLVSPELPSFQQTIGYIKLLFQKK
ncbi:phospholipid-translocating P-type ATPase [Neoconidiobolus thromboides FSU 785]|nr:phospholipid-translocating P-type ATPase [Neoconidiobolus thromboides FSU 785]